MHQSTIRGVLVLFSVLILSSPITMGNYANGLNLVADSEDPIQILFLMDNDYGANYHYIRPILESYGWNVTIAGTTGILQPCDYQSPSATLESDILVWDVEDITEYDTISIMPGESHEVLRTDGFVFNLLQDALSSGMVVSAWCKAVRVLAAADVIDGKNITGSDEFIDEYEAAGATYLGIVPPVIDGNIVTGVRSRFYREEMCLAIAEAIGVLEYDPPTISNTVILPTLLEPSDIIYVSTVVSDATGISSVYVRFYPYSYEEGNRTTTIPIEDERLTNENGTYSCEITINTKNNYTVDFLVRDVFNNYFTYSDVEIIEVDDIPTTPTTAFSSTPISETTSPTVTTSTTTSEPVSSSGFPDILVPSIVMVGVAVLIIGIIVLKRKQ